MSRAPRFALDWHGGASATLDLEATPEPDDRRYRVKYGSPFRATLRLPSEELPIRTIDFDDPRQRLQKFQQVAGYGVTRGSGIGEGALDPGPDELIRIGRSLLRLVFPLNAVSDLGGKDLFLDICIDQILVDCPWELLHDGEDFFSLKHFMGRFVNLRQPPSNRGPASTSGPDLGELKVLVVSVPAPAGRGDGQPLERLPSARDEAEAVIGVLGEAGVQPHYLDNATRSDLLDALDHPHHIIHFTGHAQFRPGGRSELVLHDTNVSVGALTAHLGHRRSVLCFVNGCETAAGGPAPAATSTGAGWDEQYQRFGLARAFLESGAYVLGTRWKLPDQAGATFAKVFYQQLLGAGVPIGRAITEARRALKDTAKPGDYSWASYVYYGDPRLAFRRLEAAAPQPGVPAVATPLRAPTAGAQARPMVSPEARAALAELAQRYEHVRSTSEADPDRTRELRKVVIEAAGLEVEPDAALVDELATGSEGERIVALALLHAHPDPDATPFLIEAIEHPRSAFEQYHALLAVKLLGNAVPDSLRSRLIGVLQDTSEQEGVFGTDRQLLANQILARLGIAPS